MKTISLFIPSKSSKSLQGNIIPEEKKKKNNKKKKLKPYQPTKTNQDPNIKIRRVQEISTREISTTCTLCYNLFKKIKTSEIRFPITPTTDICTGTMYKHVNLSPLWPPNN